jgi:tRNA U34 5-carboxymethylaminomethyl modifying GTPase MnmE/TrmE
MGFVPITFDEYIEKHLESNPSAKEADLRKHLKSAVDAYKNGIKCSCGNDIWVIGSASVGNSCFTCITGESNPTDDYEIDSAIKKRGNSLPR